MIHNIPASSLSDGTYTITSDSFHIILFYYYTYIYTCSVCVMPTFISNCIYIYVYMHAHVHVLVYYFKLYNVYMCSDPKNLEPAMLMLVDELLTAQTTGFPTNDFSKDPSDPEFLFRLKVILLIALGDYPGTGKVAHMHHAGFRACHWCWHRFDTQNMGHACAVNQRSHLDFTDPYRTHAAFGATEHAARPAFRTHAEYISLGDKLHAFEEEGKSKTFLENEMKRWGITGKSLLVNLAFFDMIWDIMPCMMHIDKGLWQKWIIPMAKGTLIARNKEPRPPATTHTSEGETVKYTAAELIVRNATWSRNLILWQKVENV
jgi:hypothetical protein